MFTQADFIVGLWFVPVVLCILIPLVMLLVYTIVQTAGGAAEKSRSLEQERKEKQEEALSEGYHPAAA